MTNRDLLALEYLAKKYDETNIPLYLSYPTTGWWKQRVTDEDFAASYEKKTGPFLYFHFPYCKKACYYCCCYKEVTSSEAEKQVYLDYLEKEFRHKLDLLDVDHINDVRHLHWGGGTPTYMSPGQIEHIYKTLAGRLKFADGGDSSISIEAYPDEEMLPLEKLRMLRRLGFNEISLGVQDFDERIQRCINRDCGEESVKRIAGQARSLGFRVHIDLCYGLPFQGLNELERTVRLVAEMSPERIAVFPYAHNPFLFPLQRRIPASALPNSFMKVMLIRRAGELFTGYGYKQVGMDHFVKPENPLFRASRGKKIIKDFMGYSVLQRRSFMGFGCSAISFMGGAYFHNAASLKEYYRMLDAGELPYQADMSHRLSRDDAVRHHIICKSILCDFVIDKNEVGGKFGLDFDDYFEQELTLLREYEKDGLVESVNGDRIVVTAVGRHLARQVAFVFDRYYRPLT
jgi:oxygen-independent coproporphyrinogen-3 oxidase